MKLLIELPNWMGDTIMCTPSINNLINFYEDPRLTLIGSQVSIDLLQNFNFVEKSVVVNSKSFSLYKKIKYLGNFDVFVSFRNSLGSNLLKLFVSSKIKYQFNKKTYIRGHLVERYCDFVNDSLNIKSPPGRLDINYEKNSLNKKKKILGINPGASYGNAKRWYPNEFAKVAASLSKDYDIVIFGGPEEKGIASEIESFLSHKRIKNFINIAAKTTISELVQQISNLDLFVTGDSGPMHIAAAFNIPTISIFGPTKDEETSQWMNEKNTIIKKNLECQPCMKRKCPLNHHNCMRLIKAKDVLKEIEYLI